jgi:membrane-bound lytic murein transglycosylase A
VLFTGYFTPTYDASLTRSDTFRWPLYRRPGDLPTDASGESTRYYTRAQIEGGGKLAGQEIAWLKDRWQAYVVTVQGSARLRLPDGRILELGYHGHNGHDYASPAMKMMADGLIRKDEVSASTLRAYFAKHPHLMDKYLWHNARTVFFTERAGGPFGSLNVPVTPMATIATDKKVYPPALPAFVDLFAVPGRDAPLRQFMLDQDTGGAIRAAGRCDLYMGVGEDAETRAGNQLSEGHLYYLVRKQ